MNVNKFKEWLEDNKTLKLSCEEILFNISSGIYDDPVQTLKSGDVVKHKDDEHLGNGIVKNIAKSGLRAYVDFGAINDWNRKKLNWKPYPAYYQINKLILVSET